MIAQAADTALADLGNHVGLTLGNAQQHNVEPAFWKKSRLRMFISHLAAYKVQASEIQTALNNRGISSFVAHSDIEPTLEWQNQIELALSTCDILVALLQPDFHGSKWTDQEIGFAMGRGLPVFAVRLGQDPYGFMGRFQAFNGHGKNNKLIADEIFLACCSNKQTQQSMAQALVSIFEDSDSFSIAKDRVGYLEKLEYWENSFIDRVSRATKVNDQINGSYGVKERISTLIKKWAAKTPK